jgi:hypothetical protein
MLPDCAASEVSWAGWAYKGSARCADMDGLPLLANGRVSVDSAQFSLPDAPSAGVIARGRETNLLGAVLLQTSGVV